MKWLPLLLLLSGCSITIDLAPKHKQPETDLFEEINKDTRFAKTNLIKSEKV